MSDAAAAMTDATPNTTVGAPTSAPAPPAAASSNKRPREDDVPAGAAASSASAANGSPVKESAEKKVKSETGAVPVGSGVKPAAGSAAKMIPKTIPKKPTVGGPTAAQAKPTSLAPKPLSLAKPAAPKSLATPTKSTSAAGAAKQKVKQEASDSSGDSSSSSDSDDEPLVTSAKKPPAKKAAAAPSSPKIKKEAGEEKSAPAAASATKKAPARKASTPKKKDESSSSESDSSDTGSDSSSDSSSDSDSSDSSDSSASDSDSSSGPRKRKPAAKGAVKKKAPAKKAASASGAANTKYGTKRPKAEGEESGSDSEEEGYDETKVILYPMDKFVLREDVLPLKETQGANKWWNRLRAPGDKTKWTTLEHNGILFPAEYAAHGKPLVYDGVEMVLPADAEEVATMWATMLDTAADFCKNPTFAKNFFRDFKATLPKDTPIKEMAKCDFEIMRVFLTRERETAKLLKKTMDKEAKAREKKEKDLLQNTYGYALVDGYKEKVGNFKVEPPNLFRGRGNHPKTGTLKRRVKPEDIIINISPGMPIPKPPVGHKWRGIIHNNRVTWLAFYRDNVNGDFKYIWLAPSSRFKGESDIKKYTKAQKLKNYISDIRKNYKKEMESAHSQFRQRATAIYLIDFLALRVGNEKDASEVADTVGCCSLRVEHLTFTPPNKVTFDFLGKDSMRYYNTVELDQQAYKNLESFTFKKKPKDEVFDNLTTTLLNEHLKSLMPELTAKVFRTYNASITLEAELRSKEVDRHEHVTQKVNFYNAANRAVAILCNHQRTVPKGHEAAVGKLREQIEALKDDREEIEDWIAEEEGGKKAKKEDKAARGAREEARAERRQARLDKVRAELRTKYEKAKADRVALRAAGKEVESEDEPEEKQEKTKSRPTDLQKALTKLNERIVNFEAKLSLRDENKEVALGTSKINYMDPRITVAWCKAKEVPLELVFNRSLVTKFPWAMEVPPTWEF